MDSRRLDDLPARFGAALGAWADDIRAALAFSTRLPIGRKDPPMAFALRALPLAGALIGAGVGAALALLTGLGLGPLAAAAAALAAQLALTGALHEDGLADVADGFGGGATRGEKLEIMRDSRIGTYGAAALTLSLLGRAVLIAEIAAGSGWLPAIAALAAAGALSRGGAVWLLAALPPARADGLGQGAGRPGRGVLRQALIAAGLIAVILGWPSVGLVFVGLAALLAAAAAYAVMTLARRQIGGQTGDVCGAVQQAAEIAALAGFAAAA